MRTEKTVALILHNIRSAHNVGAIFRTADAAGISRIYLSGYTPAPADRFGRPRPDIAKAALGAEHSVPWSSHKTPVALISKLKQEGFSIIGIEQDRGAKHYRSVRLGAKTALVLGNEVRGLSFALKKQCDMLAEIPMRGKKESLNVSVAAGIALYGIMDI